MVRLVFRPYTQVRRSICTSEPLRTSTRVSSGFILLRHSSPSFGSQHIRSTSTPEQAHGMGLWCVALASKNESHISRSSDLYFHCAFRFLHPMTRAYARLLGPCFKTGRIGDQLSYRDDASAPYLRTYSIRKQMASHRLRIPHARKQSAPLTRHDFRSIASTDLPERQDTSYEGNIFPFRRANQTSQHILTVNARRIAITSAYALRRNTKRHTQTDDTPTLNTASFVDSIRFVPSDFTSY